MSIAVETLEERCTPTTIETAFVIHLPPKNTGISVDLPLLSLGWTFTLSLTPKSLWVEKPNKKSVRQYNWIPAAFSFRQHGSATPWGDTSMHAQLSLAVEQYDCDLTEGCKAPLNNMGSNSTPLGTVEVILAHTRSLEVPLRTPCILSSRRTKVWLNVTISDCPLASGLFHPEVRLSGYVNKAAVQAQLVRQSGDRLLSQSLTTGKLFPLDVEFLTPSTRLASGNTGNPLPIYASLFVLEGHVDLSSSILKEGWTNALNPRDDTGAKHVRQILCPDDYDYELDSDFDFEDEHEDEAPPPPCHVQSESGTDRPGSCLSDFVLDRVNDQGSVDHRPEEVIKGPKEPSSDYERTVLVKFAAYRTWHAFVWYCYSGNLEFAKLKSQLEPGVRHLHVTPLEGGPPTCSPKSMYRLADLVGDGVLKKKALVAIKKGLTGANILDETFSVFTSKYPDVRKVQLGFLMEHRRSPEVKKAFLRAIGKYSSMPHAEPVLSAIYDHLVA